MCSWPRRQEANCIWLLLTGVGSKHCWIKGCTLDRYQGGCQLAQAKTSRLEQQCDWSPTWQSTVILQDPSAFCTNTYVEWGGGCVGSPPDVCRVRWHGFLQKQKEF